MIGQRGGRRPVNRLTARGCRRNARSTRVLEDEGLAQRPNRSWERRHARRIRGQDDLIRQLDRVGARNRDDAESLLTRREGAREASDLRDWDLNRCPCLNARNGFRAV